MTFLILLFLFLFSKPVFAAEINIETVPRENIVAGTTFPVTFSVVGADPNTSYHFKFYGGPEGDNYSIRTYNQDTNQTLSYNSSWDDMPSLNTDNDGNALAEGVAFIPSDKTYCTGYDYCYLLFIRIAEVTSHVGFTGYAQEIKVLAPLIIPTSTPESPTSTPIPSPTSTPASPTATKTPTPTLTPTKTPTSTPTPHPKAPTTTPTPTPDMNIFGATIESTAAAILEPTSIDYLTITPEATNSAFVQAGSNPSTPTPTPSPAKKQNFVPLIFICLGGLFLLTPLILSKIKFKS